MGGLQPWHLVIVVVVFMLLFGANKLPQMARSVGQSMRIFKAETSALSGEKDELAPAERPAPSPETPQAHLREQPPASQSG